MSDPVLIAAVSGRALAAAARRAGLRPHVLDLFGDADTRHLTAGGVRVVGTLQGGFDEAALLGAAEDLERRMGRTPLGLVYGSGFEARPGLLARLAEGRRLIGNRPEVVAGLKDPFVFFPLADRLGIPHPPVARAAPADPSGWLVKRIGGAGGAHVRPAGDPGRRADGVYFQRRVRGRPVSALFLANGARAMVLGFSAQWPARGVAGRRFLFGGAAAPAEIHCAMARDATEMIARLVAATGLVGLNSADLLVREGGFDLLEINPRPGATLDIFDRAGPPGLFALHVDGCAGRLPDRWQPPPGAAASAIVYARRRVRVAADVAWPRWAADRPAAGTRIKRGEPVCTVMARDVTAGKARSAVARRSDEILDRLSPARRAARPASRAPILPVPGP